MLTSGRHKMKPIFSNTEQLEQNPVPVSYRGGLLSLFLILSLTPHIQGNGLMSEHDDPTVFKLGLNFLLFKLGLGRPWTSGFSYKQRLWSRRQLDEI
jgi:hypothetical protein